MLFMVVNVHKGFRLSHDFHVDIDRDVCCYTRQPPAKAKC